MRKQHFFCGAALALAALLMSGCATTQAPGMRCTGNCVNGTGMIIYLRNGQLEAGTFNNGLVAGMLTITEKDGRVISVPTVNGVPHGVARIRNATGQEYEQTYAFGLPVKGKTVFSNGDVYEGSYKTVLTATGPVTVPREGTYTTAKGARYRGRFELIADQLVFNGSPRVASPLPAGMAPYTFTAQSGAELQALQARQSGWSPTLAAQPSADIYRAKLFADSREYFEFLQKGSNAASAMSLAAASGAPQGAVAQSLQPVAAAQPVAQATAVSYQLIEGNSGRYLSPFTSDGVAAGWVDKAINAKLGSQVGGAAGAYLGQKALENVPIPFVGGLLGKKVGASMGRNIALQAAGGEQYMRETSDISFNDINEMARWLVETQASHSKFAEIMKAAYQIYPELQQAVTRAQYARR